MRIALAGFEKPWCSPYHSVGDYALIYCWFGSWQGPSVLYTTQTQTDYLYTVQLEMRKNSKWEVTLKYQLLCWIIQAYKACYRSKKDVDNFLKVGKSPNNGQPPEDKLPTFTRGQLAVYLICLAMLIMIILFQYLVWRMLSIKQNVQMDEFPVLFENIKVHRNMKISISSTFTRVYSNFPTSNKEKMFICWMVYIW